jgi:pseudouridine synthase
MIVEGKVTVNGEPVTQVGVTVDEDVDEVRVEGQLCQLPSRAVYIALYKPRDYIVTLDDQYGRKTVMELLQGVDRRVYPVGRLDYDSEGLLLLTDDGELAFRLAHPSFGIRKQYSVRVRGEFRREDLERFRQGITLEDGHVARAEARLRRAGPKSSILSLVLTEGRKREIKRMCRTIGYPVTSLRRTKFDDISIAGLKPGQWRHLSSSEVATLRRHVGLEEA